MTTAAEDLAFLASTEHATLFPIDLTINESITRFASLGEKFNTVVFDSLKHHFMESSNNQKFCETILVLNGKNVGKFREYITSNSTTRVDFENANSETQTSVLVMKVPRIEEISGLSASPPPLRFYYHGRTSLFEAIPKAKARGNEVILGRECIIYDFPVLASGVKPQYLTYYLDRATSVPLKVVSFAKEVDRIDQNPLWVWTASKCEAVGSHLMPTISEVTMYENKVAVSSNKFQVVNCKFGVNPPSDTFRPIKVQASAYTENAITKKASFPKAQKIEKREILATTEHRDHSNVPEDSYFGVAMLLPVGILALSAAALLAWRRRQGRP